MIHVGLGEYCITDQPNTVVAHALGSCVAFILHSPEQNLTAVAHIVLPESHGDSPDGKEAYYADIIIPKIYQYFIQDRNCNKEELKAVVVGGATKTGEDAFMIGYRNVVAVETLLKQYALKEQAKDVFGAYSRTVIVNPVNGQVTVQKQKAEILDDLA